MSLYTGTNLCRHLLTLNTSKLKEHIFLLLFNLDFLALFSYMLMDFYYYLALHCFWIKRGFDFFFYLLFYMEWFKIKERDCPHYSFYFICLFFFAFLPKEKHTVPLKWLTYPMVILGDNFGEHLSPLLKTTTSLKISTISRRVSIRGRGTDTEGDLEKIIYQPSDVIPRGLSSQQKITLLTS